MAREDLEHGGWGAERESADRPGQPRALHQEGRNVCGSPFQGFRVNCVPDKEALCHSHES